jgi:hypothetical protein
VALNKIGRVYSLAPGDAAKLLPKGVLAAAAEQKKAVLGGKKAKK